MRFFHKTFSERKPVRQGDPRRLVGLFYPDLAGVFLFLILAVGIGEFSLSWLARSPGPTAGEPVAARPARPARAVSSVASRARPPAGAPARVPAGEVAPSSRLDASPPLPAARTEPDRLPVAHPVPPVGTAKDEADRRSPRERAPTPLKKSKPLSLEPVSPAPVSAVASSGPPTEVARAAPVTGVAKAQPSEAEAPAEDSGTPPGPKPLSTGIGPAGPVGPAGGEETRWREPARWEIPEKARRPATESVEEGRRGVARFSPQASPPAEGKATVARAFVPGDAGRIAPREAPPRPSESASPTPPPPSPPAEGKATVARASVPGDAGRVAPRETPPRPPESPASASSAVGSGPTDARQTVVERRLMAMVSSSDLRAMMKGVWETYRLRRVRIGESLFRWDPDRGAVAYEDAGGFGLRGGGPPKAGQAKSRAPIRTVAALRGEIEGSLYKSLIRAGGSAALAVTFAEVFRWSVDFRADVRRGDVFSVVAEQWATKGGRLRWGRILAAELRTRSGTYRAVAFPSRNGRLRYYNAEGKPLRRYFLRTPLNYTRISSGYSLRRFHPILKIHRPHRGIDYAAPAGTPVRAAADGVVAMARWAGEGGKTVRISHPGGFSTVYHHLSRYGRGIRRGRRVARGRVIGYVGSTGLSTGPHLDFRVLRNGRPVNPLSMKLIAGRPLPRADRVRFFRIRDALLGQFRTVIRLLEARAEVEVVAVRTASP